MEQKGLERLLAAVTYEVGDTIEYALFGGDKRRICKVIERHEDIKNGRAGFDAEMPNGTLVWGYDDDVIAVVKP